MDSQATSRERVRRLGFPWTLVLVWVPICASVAAGLTVQVRRDVQPWGAVPLAAGVAADADTEADGRIAGWHREGRPVAVDAAGERVAVGRPNSQIEVWDLGSAERLITLQATGSIEPAPEHGTPSHIYWLRGGRRLLYQDTLDYAWHVRDIEDHPPVELPMSRNARAAAPSPDGRRVAYATLGQVIIYDLDEAEVAWYWDLERANGDYRRLAWSADGERLLLADRNGIYVWNVAGDELLFYHRELDLRLPEPMIADEQSGFAHEAEPVTQPGPPDIASRFAHVAHIADARFTPDGRHVLAVYRSVQVIRPGMAGAYRVRLYDARSGELIEDRELTHPPRIVRLTGDGERVLIVSRFDDSGRDARMDVFTLDGLAHEHAHVFSPSYYFPAAIAGDATGRWAVVGAHETWLIDLAEEYPPLRLPVTGNTLAVEMLDDGRVLHVGRDGSVHILERRREPSVYGARGYGSLWMLHGVSLAGMLGLVVLVGVNRQKIDRRRLPVALWAAALLVAYGLGSSIAAELASYATDGVFLASNERETGRWSSLAVSGFLAAALAGTVHLRPGWRLVLLAFQWLALLIFGASLLVWGYSLTIGRGLTPAADRPPLHDGMADVPLWIATGLVLFSLGLQILTLWLLHHRTVRARLPANTPRVPV